MKMETNYSYIGLDFDNTIACYDHVFIEVAKEKGWYLDDRLTSKRQIRNSVQDLEKGEEKWQFLQMEVYGPRMHQAKLAGGVVEFLSICHQHKVQTCVISHKTKYAKYSSERLNLRKSALNWMKNKGLLKKSSPGFCLNSIFFEDTRKDKIQRIRNERCTHFVDDLVEVFDHNQFPKNIDKYLYAPDGYTPPNRSYRSYKNWVEITDAIFCS